MHTSWMITCLATMAVCRASFNQLMDVTEMLSGDTDMAQQLSSRDAEPLPGPLAYGHKFMTGGTGEGSQALKDTDRFETREEVKTDALLPAYCQPPNPCPQGYGPKDGCIEDFMNTADFSRNYQANQQCICDQEHMFSCENTGESTVEDEEGGESESEEIADINKMLRRVLHQEAIDSHQSLIAKKYHQKRAMDAAIGPR